MKKFKILITGGAGYIGSMLSTKLINLGNEVTVIDILEYDSRSLSHLYLNKNFTFIKKDVRDKKFLKKIIKKFDYVIPLACLVGAPLCVKIILCFLESIETKSFTAFKFISMASFFLFSHKGAPTKPARGIT